MNDGYGAIEGSVAHTVPVVPATGLGIRQVPTACFLTRT
jgi:hypothetical protein